MSRTIGSKNKKTIQWENLAVLMTGSGAERMRQLLDSMQDEEFVDTYLKLLSYFKPKQQSNSIRQEGEINISIVSDDEQLMLKI